jgi:nucleoside-diphosphate-sugar epimerase
MRTALVTGAAGVMGARLTARLQKDGWNVRALVLPNDPLKGRVDAACDVREGNVAEPGTLQGLCDGVDIVFHLAAVIISHDTSVFARVNRDGTANLVAEAQRAGVPHFVYVSSASVVYPRRTLYAQSKLEAELVVKSSGLPYTIVRPTLVYERGGGQELMMFLAYLRRFPVVPFIGDGSARKRPVWSEDIVDGLARVAASPAAPGKTYNFSGAEAITMLELAQLLLLHHDRPRQFLHLPVWLCRATAAALRVFTAQPALTSSAIAGVVNDADLDPTEAMADLGYAPLGVRAGFLRCFPLAANDTAGSTPVTTPLAKGSMR